MRYLNTFAVVLFTIGSAVAADPAVAVTGELKQWHKVTLTLDGPSASESGTPNPFTDYRFDVTFSNGALTYVVPGYFAADGNAGESSATSGVKWRAHLSPDVTGTWNWTIGFRQGSNVAQNGGGTTLAPYHGVTGSFTIAASDKSGRDFRGKGRLEYVNQRYLRHKGNNEWFIKAGADSPENFLNNNDIDGTVTQSGTDRRHTWAAHVGDWQAGDPSWKSGKGKGAIGALNYLASTGNNVFSFLTMNINGDSKDVWPYYDYTIRTRMDCSKLDQWEQIFEHADRKGLYLHFKTQETENETLLDGGATGNERKLYYRELIARFGHHLALNWNLGEESSDQNDQQRKDMAAYFHDTDPYHHLVVLHTYPGAQEAIYRPLLGSASRLTGASVQIGWDGVHTETRQWINESVAAEKPWVVANDEQGSAGDGIPPQAGWAGYGGGGPSRDALRHQTLWGNFMAGGAGVEAYFGYSHPDSDLSCRDWRSRADWWAMGNHALVFFRTHLPFSEMTSQDPLVGNASSASSGRYCFAKAGATYAVYIPAGAGGTATLDLSGQSGTYTVQWYNPRTGGALQNGGTTSVTVGGSRALGTPPADNTRDWVVLVKLSGSPPANQAPVVNAGENQSITLPSSAALAGSATDDGQPTGGSLTQVWSKVSGPGTVTFGNASAFNTTATFSTDGIYVLRLSASDTELSSSDDVQVTVLAAGSPFITVSLINADTDLPIAGFDPLANGAVLNLAQLPTRNLAVRANVNGTVGSVRMILSGAEARTQTEGVAPYSLHGDTNGDFAAWTPVLGSYGLNATAYSATLAGGTVLGTQSIAFTVIDQGTPVNAAPTVSAGPNQSITLPATATLAGTATDDGLPAASTLATTWSKVSGPGTVTFGNAGQLSTSATFSLAGTYVLRLTASDGTLSSQDDLSVIVAAAPVVPPTPPTTPASPTITGDGTATPTLSGVPNPALAGAVIHILVDGVEVGTTTAAGDGSWSYTITTVTPGSHTITVTASNAGGSSPASTAITVTVAASGGSGSGSSSSSSGGGCGLGGGVAAAMLLGMLAMFGLRRSGMAD